MRRPSGRSRSPALAISLAEFGWPASLVATTWHSTLPWWDDPADEIQLKGVSLKDARLGSRDALSAFGQYVAHEGFLRAGSIDDATFDPAEWVIVRKRGEDVRLVRIRGREAAESGGTSWLICVERAAKQFGIPQMPALGHAWANPEAVFIELWGRMKEDAAADLRWFRRAAVGVHRSPGSQAVDSMLAMGGVVAYADDDTLVSIEIATRLGGHAMTLLGGGDASPLRQGSSLGPFVSDPGVDGKTASEVAERIIGDLGRRRAVIAVRRPEQFDELSRSVVRTLLREARSTTWIVPEKETELAKDAIDVAPRSRAYAIARSFEVRARLDERFSSVPAPDRLRWIAELVEGPALEGLLDEGVVPADPAGTRLESIPEPRRSFLAALALVGAAIDLDVARGVLDDLGCGLDLRDLGHQEVFVVGDEMVEFTTEDIRRALASSVPRGMRAGIMRLAAGRTEALHGRLESARLLIGAGALDEAVSVLERSLEEPQNRDRAKSLLAECPSEVFVASPRLALERAESLVGEGRYESARRLIESLQGDERDLLLARIERRQGRYGSALALVGEAPAGFEGWLLRGELLRLVGNEEEAERSLGVAEGMAGGVGERSSVEWQRALLTLDRAEIAEPFSDEFRAAEPYLARRLDGYLAAARRDFGAAADAARDSLEMAASRSEAIDAALDLHNARFLAGDWDRARHEARDALELIEETEGDRAAGGVLFTFAFLCADDGQWETAFRLTERLERFYRAAGDDRRFTEVDLIRTQIALGRLDLDEARRRARSVVSSSVSGDIREAALLALDEADWIEGSIAAIRTCERIVCQELLDRHNLNGARVAGRPPGELSESFSRRLAEWELAWSTRATSKPPDVNTGSERLRLARSLAGLYRRRADETLLQYWKDLTHATGLDPSLIEEHSRRRDAGVEAELIRRLVLASFPPGPEDLGPVKWRFVTRNRLGSWAQAGSDAELDRKELEEIVLDLPDDWSRVGDSAWLCVEDWAEWPAESRDAVVELFRIRSEHANLRRLVDQEALMIAERPVAMMEGIVGESAVIHSLVERAHRVAGRDVPVCIEGETGTGKELVARAIHRASSRKQRPFTPVNCAALPENLIESELFGSARGAFTGADRDRAGLIETSDGGTLFLDEVGEMPLQAQAKLLRFLQEGEFRRVGDATVRTANVRLVTATNRRLEQAIDEGRFREDLYYRIKVVDLAVPPLRERGGDVLLLARHFLARERDRHGAGPDRFTDDVESVFRTFPWPGNVRELENTVRAAHAVAGDARAIDLDHLPERLRTSVPKRRTTGAFFDQVNRFRRSLVENALAEAGGNQSKAAKSLGMSRQALAYQIKELGILVGKKK